MHEPFGTMEPACELFLPGASRKWGGMSSVRVVMWMCGCCTGAAETTRPEP